jgi:hypothetical protein
VLLIKDLALTFAPKLCNSLVCFAEELGESRTDVAGLTTDIPNAESTREAVVRQGKRTGGNKSKPAAIQLFH